VAKPPKWQHVAVSDWWAGIAPIRHGGCCGHDAQVHVIALQRGKVREIRCHGYDDTGGHCQCMTWKD
jgi:hypothetical protein